MMTALEIVNAIETGVKTAEEITRESLAKIAELNPQINALVEVFEADSLAQAKAVDAKKARGEKLGPLAGVPVAIKDNILTRAQGYLLFQNVGKLCGRLHLYGGGKISGRGCRDYRTCQYGRICNGQQQPNFRLRAG